QHLVGVLPGAHLGEGGEDALPRGRQGREGQRVEVEGSAPGPTGLGLRGRQQHEHPGTLRGAPRVSTMGQRGGILRHTDPATSEVVDAAGLRSRLDAIRAELEVPDEFPPEVVAEAERVADRPLSLPERDETDLPFLTIDPPGSMDLDQAMHLSRDGDGYRVRYAIAHLESFVEPGGAIDAEARRRGQTIYAPDQRTPLHPAVLSEGAAS